MYITGRRFVVIHLEILRAADSGPAKRNQPDWECIWVPSTFTAQPSPSQSRCMTASQTDSFGTSRIYSPTWLVAVDLFHFWLWITRFSIISDPAALLYREFISCMIGWSGNNSKKRGLFVKERVAAANYTEMIIVAGPKTSRRRSHAMQRRWNCCCSRNWKSSSLRISGEFLFNNWEIIVFIKHQPKKAVS